MNACKKDPEPVNEEEVITTVILSLQKKRFIFGAEFRFQ